MPDTQIGVDVSRKAHEQPLPPHNRWHPDIPAAASVELGQSFRIECLDWTNGQIANDVSANDVRDVDLRHVHVLSGPIHVNGVEPDARGRAKRARARRAKPPRASASKQDERAADAPRPRCSQPTVDGRPLSWA